MPEKYDLNWLKQQEKPTFFGFWGDRLDSEHHRVFSNFHPAPFNAPTHKGIHRFKHSEQYFMYLKAQVFNDPIMMDKLLTDQPNPSIYKNFGKKVRGFNEQTWKKHRTEAMYKATYAKFNQNKDLKKHLLNTNQDVLVETSPYDRIWGIGLAKFDRNGRPDNRWLNPENWEGLNLLGFTLMTVRDDLTDLTNGN